jgi:kynurenine formamidase
LIEGLALADVKRVEIGEADIVLFKCGSKSFTEPGYYEAWPEVPEEIADYLIEKKVKVIGVDMPSPDHEPFRIHKKLLGAGILIIENLTNLDKLVGKDFTIYALPIKFALDGAPARVIAEIK